PHSQAGKIKIVAVGSAQRLPILPDVPTVAEQGYPGFESSQWFGLLAPAGTPQEAISRLQAAAQRALRTDAVRQRLAHDAAEPSGAGPAEFAAFVDAEERRWSQVVKDARLSAE
ncbi:tripartite tricarboxylate transporter substrate-binding protein, partial [Achromobacter dolens]|uniref:tripartite tricarboxylate transporter substrate-binding protein n=1 Tax=Achromobacter dolens TaxID=1287738 RepID=UPI0022B8659B